MQGYGFLSENATFVDICKDHGIEFIGPTSSHINTMGDKSTARDTMKVHTFGCQVFTLVVFFPVLHDCYCHVGLFRLFSFHALDMGLTLYSSELSVSMYFTGSWSSYSAWQRWPHQGRH